MSSYNLTSLRSLLAHGTSFLSQLPLLSSLGSSQTENSVSSGSSYAPFSNAPSCPVNGPLSCHNSTEVTDSCCFIANGLLLQTQFWDAKPAIGPADSWTLHGLWPDNCDGTYPTYCTSAPIYKNITQIMEAENQDLLDFMNEYWLPNSGTAERFWEHEWSKHGTCINTLSPSCYGDGYAAGQEVVDFFARAVDLFKTLDTYAALADAGIVPSTSKTYTLSAIQDALSKVTGFDAVVSCYRGQLNQAWYYYNVKGSVQTGQFIATTAPGSGRGGCPKSGIRYLPKSSSGSRDTDTQEVEL